MRAKMNHYIAGDHLLQQNLETDVYRIRNTVKRESPFLTKEEFDAIPDKKKIKREKFSQLMNEFFSTVEHTWEFEGKQYTKLPNFSNRKDGPNNYSYSDMPKHERGTTYKSEFVLVYHWGRIYLFSWSYNGYPQGQLMEIKTGNYVRWAKPRHCAPVFCITDRKLV